MEKKSYLALLAGCLVVLALELCIMFAFFNDYTNDVLLKAPLIVVQNENVTEKAETDRKWRFVW